MEEAIRKQGLAYLQQQQRFGKRWRRVWCMLFRDSSCSIARLEYFDCKDGGLATLDKSDKALKKQQESKKVIRLSDCVRVAAVPVDGCPRDTGSFLVETTDKLYVFAVDTQHLDDWTHSLCETAFPRDSLQKRGRNDEEGMEDNSLYSSRDTLHDFRVCVRWTETAERCGLVGALCVLRTEAECLCLLDPDTHRPLLSWPYRFLRRFGRDKSSFSFEAGRRCASGEGSFEFDTKQGSALFKALDSAITAQRQVLPHRYSSGAELSSPEISQHRALHVPQQPDESHLEPPADKVLTGVKSLTLDTREIPTPRKTQVKSMLSCPLLSGNPDPIPSLTIAPNLSAGPYHVASSNPTLNPDPDQTYAEVSRDRATGGGREKREPRDMRREGGGGSPCPPALPPQEPAYSLPFDHLAARVTEDSQELFGEVGWPDPLYDKIDESQIKTLQGVAAASRGAYGQQAENIYDQPESYSTIGPMAPPPPPPPASMYDNPEEVRLNAWRTMGIGVEPAGHECRYNAELDDYAVPQHRRAVPVHQAAGGEGEEDPYSNTAGRAGEEDPYSNTAGGAGRQDS